MQRSQRGLIKGTRDIVAHISLALPKNRERATNRLATGPEDARERRQARVRARRVQRLTSETAEEQEIRLCRRREGERNCRASVSEEAREHRLARDRARRRQRFATCRENGPSALSLLEAIQVPPLSRSMPRPQNPYAPAYRKGGAVRCCI